MHLFPFLKGIVYSRKHCVKLEERDLKPTLFIKDVNFRTLRFHTHYYNFPLIATVMISAKMYKQIYVRMIRKKKSGLVFRVMGGWGDDQPENNGRKC